MYNCYGVKEVIFMTLVYEMINLSMIFFVIGNSALAAISFIMYLKSKDSYLLNYMLSFLFLALGQFFLMLSTYHLSPIWLIFFSFFTFFSVFYLLKGVVRFLKLKTGHSIYLLPFFFVVSFVIIGLTSPTEQSFQIQLYFITGFIYLITAYLLLKTRDAFYRLVGIGFFLISVINYLYPFSQVRLELLLFLLFLLTSVGAMSYIGLLGIHFMKNIKFLLRKIKKYT